MAETTATKTKTDPTTADLQAQIETLRGDISDLTSTLGRYAKSRGRNARSSAEAQADHFMREAQSAYGEAEAQVRANPAAAIGLAAGIGFLIGLISSRR